MWLLSKSWNMNEHNPAKQSYQIWRKNFQVSLPVSTPLRVVNRCWSGFPCKWRYINVETFNLLPSNHILRVGSFFSRTLYIFNPPPNQGSRGFWQVVFRNKNALSGLPRPHPHWKGTRVPHTPLLSWPLATRPPALFSVNSQSVRYFVRFIHSFIFV